VGSVDTRSAESTNPSSNTDQEEGRIAMKTTDEIWNAIHPLGLSSTDAGKGYCRSSCEARAITQAESKPDVEKERKEAEQEVTKVLDPEATAAVDQTLEAVQALAQRDTDRAVAAIEGAIGKIDVVRARRASKALIPVDLEVDIIDAAPRDVDVKWCPGGLEPPQPSRIRGF
jgi:hypothetical protein